MVNLTVNTPSSSTTNSIFEVIDLSITTAQKTLVKGLNWRINTGERWVILGANGCGKSSLLHACAGLPLLGRKVTYEGLIFATQRYTPATAAPHCLAPLRSYCPQRLDWSAHLTPLQLANLLNISNSVEINKAFNANKYHQEIAKCFEEMLPAVWLHQPIGQRSGGEQQRIALALTLAQVAPLVFLDEPLTHLDEVQQIQTLQHLTASGKTLIMVSHHIRLSLAFATHVLLPVSAIGQGAWLAGTRDTVANIENLAAAYNINTHLAAQLLAGNVVS